MRDLEGQIQELLDRQAIFDCVQRYARGIDRDDVDLVASCYHPDAIDDHGFYVGPGRGLAEWAIAGHRGQLSGQHHITNHLVELDGDTAHSETYFITIFRRGPGGLRGAIDALQGNGSVAGEDQGDLNGSVGIGSGRYIDRFERRDGEWRIAARVFIVETLVDATVAPMAAIERASSPFTRDLSDPSYRRPLTVSRRSAQEEHPPLRDPLRE